MRRILWTTYGLLIGIGYALLFRFLWPGAPYLTLVLGMGAMVVLAVYVWRIAGLPAFKPGHGVFAPILLPFMVWLVVMFCLCLSLYGHTWRLLAFGRNEGI